MISKHSGAISNAPFFLRKQNALKKLISACITVVFTKLRDVFSLIGALQINILFFLPLVEAASIDIYYFAMIMIINLS